MRQGHNKSKLTTFILIVDVKFPGVCDPEYAIRKHIKLKHGQGKYIVGR